MLLTLFANPWILSVLFAMLSPERQEELNKGNSCFFQPSASSLSNSRKHESESKQTLPKYINTNTWPRSSRGRKLKKSANRSFIHGVEIRRLEDPHPLSGQLGLFAAQRFEKFDILGEYCAVDGFSRQNEKITVEFGAISSLAVNKRSPFARY